MQVEALLDKYLQRAPVHNHTHKEKGYAKMAQSQISMHVPVNKAQLDKGQATPLKLNSRAYAYSLQQRERQLSQPRFTNSTLRIP